MGTRTVWLCLAWGIACSPTPAADADRRGKEIKTHETSTNPNQTVPDAAVASKSSLLDAGEPLAEDTDTTSDASAVKAARPGSHDAGHRGLSGADAGLALAADTSHGTLPTEPADAEAADEARDAAPDPTADAAVCNVPQITGSECDLATNCGCDGETVCRVADQHTGQTLCFPPGESASYSPCELDQDCALGQVCEASLCRPPCDNPGLFCDDGSSCATFSEGGRNVCAGHCNVLARAPDGWSTAQFWILLMAGQNQRGLRGEYWTAEYSDCGRGAYCHPGVGPLEDSSPSPLYPHCVAANGAKLDNAYCSSSEDCASGLACGVYTGETQGRCIRLGVSDSDCQETGHGLERGSNVDGAVMMAPDGTAILGLCTKDLD